MFIALLCCSIVFSQEKTIFGNAINFNGTPLRVATMLGTTPSPGMATDFDANFGKRVTNGQTLLISHIGFETEEILETNLAKTSLIKLN